MEESSVHETKEIHRATDKRGRRIVNQYTFIRKLGEGAYGKVKLAECNGTYFAIKVINKDLLRRQREFIVNPKGGMSVKTALQDAFREIAIMKKLLHENVVHLHEVIDDEEREKLYLILDYCGKGPILEWVAAEQRFISPFDSGEREEFDEGRVRSYFRQMVSGLQYLHAHHIIHRDIKPQNILVTLDGVVKIADFGQAIIFDADDAQQKSFGTLQFFPPEYCSPGRANFSGKAADVWALGLTLYAMVYRHLPYKGESYSEVMESISTFELNFPPVPHVTGLLKDLIVRLLDKNPSTRVKLPELMADAWVNCESPLLRPRPKLRDEVSTDEINDAVLSIGNVIFIKPLSRRRGK